MSVTITLSDESIELFANIIGDRFYEHLTGEKLEPATAEFRLDARDPKRVAAVATERLRQARADREASKEDLEATPATPETSRVRRE